jgi:hypothetical protein
MYKQEHFFDLYSMTGQFKALQSKILTVSLNKPQKINNCLQFNTVSKII